MLSALQQKFPEDIECVVDPISGRGGIYVSNIEVAENPRTLQRFGIEAVISAVKGKNLDSLLPRHIEYLYIPAVDHESFDISYYFEEANQFIDDQRKRTNVLVHCMAGISRSVTLIMAYLMKNMNKSFDDAYHLMKVKRKIMHPNDSFLEQLRVYGSSLRSPLSEKNWKENSNRMKESPIQKQNKLESCRAVTSEKKSKYENNSNYDENLKQNIKMLFRSKSPVNSRVLR